LIRKPNNHLLLYGWYARVERRETMTGRTTKNRRNAERGATNSTALEQLPRTHENAIELCARHNKGPL